MRALAAVLNLLAATPEAGEVTLPLRDYLALVESVEAADRARAAQARPEAAGATLLSYRLRLDLTGPAPVAEAIAEVDLRGEPPLPLAVPVVGAATAIRVEPPEHVLVSGEGTHVMVAPTRPGRRTVRVQSRVADQDGEKVWRVSVPALSAGVAEAELIVPPGHEWSAEGALSVDPEPGGASRPGRLTLPRERATVVEVRPARPRGEPDRTLASAVVVTLLGFDADGLLRHDMVLYEVERGEIRTHQLTMPDGLHIEQVLTDAAEEPPYEVERTLTVHRPGRLTSTGHVLILSRPAGQPRVPVSPVVPEVPVRARYLVLRATATHEVTPEPAAAWTRVDLTDLPGPVSEAAAALGLSAAWRQRPDAADPGVSVRPLPAAALAPQPVRQRETTTLLTRAGTLLHRDRFELDHPGPAFELALPGQATLWSLRVDGVAVRAPATEGRLRIPLASETGATVEVVTVEERDLAADRGPLALALARADRPVLQHRWRLLLPEGYRYRRVASTLAGLPRGLGFPAVPTLPAPQPVLGPGGPGGVRGQVVNEQGAAVPGATVTVWNGPRVATATSDGNGLFDVRGLPAGHYIVHCELGGFTRQEQRVSVFAGRAGLVTCVMKVAGMTEAVEVRGQAPVVDEADAEEWTRRRMAEQGRGRRERAAEQRAAGAESYARQAEELRQGLVAGVRPVQVAIPEEGKVLLLAGALPPEEVSLTLERRRDRD